MGKREEVIGIVLRLWPKYDEEDFIDMSYHDLVTWIGDCFGQQGLDDVAARMSA